MFGIILDTGYTVYVYSTDIIIMTFSVLSRTNCITSLHV